MLPPFFMRYTFDIFGRPVPQPRPRVFNFKGVSRTVSDSKGSNAWKRAIRTQLGRITPLSGPLAVELTFRFARPKSHFRADGVTLSKAAKENSGSDHCTSKRCGDADNLAKAVLDALEQSGAIVNDSHVCELFVRKEWVRGASLEGVTIELEQLLPH